MNQQDFFDKTLEVLTRLRIPHMITGSVGAMFYSIPRMTNDMDLVVDLFPEKISPLLREFPTDHFYYPPEEFIREQIKNRGQWNLIHIQSGSKVDFILRKDTPFGIEEFSKRTTLSIGDSQTLVTASPEALILSKLEAYRQGRSEKHLRDIQSILQVSRESLDISYISTWVTRLNLMNEWKTAQTHPLSE